MRVAPLSQLASVFMTIGVLFASGSAMAQQAALTATATPNAAIAPCPTDEPDTVQISWTKPCDEGGWLMDPEAGCRMWDWHPEPTDSAAWTGACKASLKQGRGVVQWFEHGLPIDRFEGTYSDGRREGFGRYEWNDNDRFEGTYADGLPNGQGTVRLEGEVLTGQWKNGCLKYGDRTVAIGVPLNSCTSRPELLAGS